eukprot:scaffold36346_cov80-Skeletonema_marinoi.AAC.1
MVYASQAATVRSRFDRYEIIVAISGIKSAIFNSVRPYYGRFGDDALQVKDPSRTMNIYYILDVLGALKASLSLSALGAPERCSKAESGEPE